MQMSELKSVLAAIFYALCQLVVICLKPVLCVAQKASDFAAKQAAKKLEKLAPKPVVGDAH